jgi:threonine aldolase
VKLGISPREAAKGIDSVSVCLSKGLGAPVGSVPCGSRAFIERALRWRKMLGGGMRQVAYSLRRACTRWSTISRGWPKTMKTRAPRAGLADIAEIKVTTPDTNIVYVDMPAGSCALLDDTLRRKGILSARVTPHMRIALHLDVSPVDVDRTIAAFKGFFAL